MAYHALGAADRELSGVIAKDLLDRFGLGHIT
jgi:hypothetical protein